MITANIADLKQKLSLYLRSVEAGEQVPVTSHRRPVARLVPEAGDEPVVRTPTRPVADLLPLLSSPPARYGGGVGKTLTEDRRRR